MTTEFDPLLIDIIKNKVQIWQQAENRAKEWLKEAQRKKREAVRQLHREQNRK